MKNRFLRINRQKFTGVLSILLFLAAGILLLARPQLITDLAIWVFAVVLLGVGLYWAVRYFRSTPEAGAASYDLAEALVAFSAGAVILLRRDLFSAALPMLWGAMLILGGFMILQTAIDFFRMRYIRWWILLLGSLVALVLGALALVRPAFLEGRMPLYVGISLICEAVIDLVSLILMALHARGKLPLRGAASKTAKAAPAAPVAPAPMPDAAKAPAAQPEPPKASQPDAQPEPPKAPQPDAPATIMEELARYAEQDRRQDKKEAE